MNLAQRFADLAGNVKFEGLAPGVIHEVKRRVIDSMGCMLGGWSAQPCIIARKVASEFGAKRGSTVFGTSHRAPPDWAAFANGCMVRYLDFNDTYLSKEPAHPSDNIPAAMAVAQARGRGGRELIAAIALAYEVQCRLCDATSLRAIGWDHVTYGAFSTALASSYLMHMDKEQAVHALGIAGVTSAALRQSRVGMLSHWKGCAFANSARHGVYAAMLAESGMTGPAPIFEGEKGFEKLVSGPLPIEGPFGKDWAGDYMIVRTSIKCWPVEYHAQSAVQAALELRPQVDAEIESILIESHSAAVQIIGSEHEKWRPTSRETADHSLPYITAAALKDGRITAEQFDPKRFTNAELLDLTAKVTVREDKELSSIYPGAVANRVTVTLKGGRELSTRVDYPLGHAKNPMSDDQVAGKFHTMADPMLGKLRAKQLLDRCWQLEDVSDWAEFLAMAEVKA